MVRIGIIHIGSSKIRLTLAEIEDVGYFKIIDELKTPYKVCFEVSKECVICSQKLNYIISTIDTYKSLSLESGAKEVFIITTSFFKKVKDSNLISSILNENLGLKVKILSEEEEINLSALSVTKSLKVDNSLIVDITGTSTNLISIKNSNIYKWISIPFGAISLAYTFNLTDRILNTNLKESSSFVKDKLDSIPWINDFFESIIFMGDFAKTITKIDKQRTHYPLQIFNNYEISPVAITEIYNVLKAKDLKLRSKIDGIDINTVDSIVSALLIFKQILKITSPNIIRIANSSIREGMLYSYLIQNYSVTDNILDYSIYGILNSLNCNITHAEQVYWISKNLYDKLKPLHKLDDSYLKILKTGAMLHDCGVSINYQEHHKHSLYIILNSMINELSHKEYIMSAAIAASHRFNNYHLPLVQFSYLINRLDIDIINKIGALVKIAEGLDRSLVSSVKKLNVEFTDDYVKIIVSSPNELNVEIHQALRGKYFFKKIYNRELIIEKKSWND